MPKTLLISADEPTTYFVYGTLRVGAGEWARDGYVKPPVPLCTAKGDLYNYGFAFPYADFDGEGTIIGDLATVDPRMAHHIARVEIGAGYEAREVIVTTPSGEQRVAVGWHICDRTRRRVGLTLIPSGDWLACISEETGRYSSGARA